MPYGVELRFAPDLASRIGALRAAHVPGDALQGGMIPHLSLAVYVDLSDGEVGALADLLDALAAEWRPMPVELASLGVFPTEQNVLFLAPVVTSELLAIHAHYHELAAKLGLVCWPHYLRGTWVPHCTLAMWLPSADLLRGIEQLKAAWTPLAGELQSIALIRAEPPETLHERSLGRAHA